MKELAIDIIRVMSDEPDTSSRIRAGDTTRKGRPEGRSDDNESGSQPIVGAESDA
jgi:hypothetical protein